MIAGFAPLQGPLDQPQVLRQQTLVSNPSSAQAQPLADTLLQKMLEYPLEVPEGELRTLQVVALEFTQEKPIDSVVYFLKIGEGEGEFSENRILGLVQV